MPRRRDTADFETRRSARRAAPAHESRQRGHLAQIAARLIAEHGIADWSLAKRKAVRELGLPDSAALPADEEIEAALADYHLLFGGSEHAARLRGQREEALDWMRRLEAFAPRLAGGVAAGWATAHTDIRIELVAPDAKVVELVLINAGVRYRTLPDRAPGAAPGLFIETGRGGVCLVVRTPDAARQRAHDAGGRLGAAEVEALLPEEKREWGVGSRG
jgi:phage tail protein X